MIDFPERPELQGLLDALVEERISRTGIERIQEIVLSRPEAEEYYIQYVGTCADLVHLLSISPKSPASPLSEQVQDEGGPGSSDGLPSLGTSHVLSGRFRRIAVAVAGGTLVGLYLFSTTVPDLLRTEPRQARTTSRPVPTPTQALPGDVNPDSGGYYVEENEVLDDTVAVLVADSSAVWDQSGPSRQTGATLAPGWLFLKSGFAQIEFYSGATVILEGPTDFQIVSSMEGYCARGKLRGRVPPHAQGFKIRSPGIDLVDRGTEFGMKVEGIDSTEVHVFDGKVELYKTGDRPASGPEHELITGQAVRIDSPEIANSISSDPESFLSSEELAARSAADANRRQGVWLARSEKRRHDPSLAVYYDFQPDDVQTRILENRVVGTNVSSHGTIVGCNWGAGRWPGKLALDYRQVSDRVRINIPGEFDAATMAMWVRVDAMPNRRCSLLLTDGWDDLEAHWHIDSKGTIELGVQGPREQRGAHYYAPGQFQQEYLGQWIHLAVVYDRHHQHVIQYINGKPISDLPITLDVPIRFGACELGNWNRTTRAQSHPVRYLTGRIDEFMLYSRALTGEEIADLATESG